MSMKDAKKHSADVYERLPALFFETRQIIRSLLPRHKSHNANNWLRCETMRFVAENSNPTMHDLAAHLRTKAPSVTALISNLRTRDLLVATPDKLDKRVLRLSLTRKGEQHLVRYRKESGETMHKVFSHLDAHDIRTLVRILSQVRDAHRER